MVAKNDRINVLLQGHDRGGDPEEPLSEAKDKAAAERTAREKEEAWVEEVQKEL